MNLIVIKTESMEALHESVGEAIEVLYEMQDEIEREIWFAEYLRGPFWWL